VRLPSFEYLLTIREKLEREAMAKKIKAEIFGTLLDVRKILLKYGHSVDDNIQVEIFLFSVSLAVFSISRARMCYSKKKKLMSSVFGLIAADFDGESPLLIQFLDNCIDIYATWASAGPTILTSVFADRIGFDLDEREFFDIRGITISSTNRFDAKMTH
jgi:hypothetical protein